MESRKSTRKLEKEKIHIFVLKHGPSTSTVQQFQSRFKVPFMYCDKYDYFHTSEYRYTDKLEIDKM